MPLSDLATIRGASAEGSAIPIYTCTPKRILPKFPYPIIKASVIASNLAFYEPHKIINQSSTDAHTSIIDKYAKGLHTQ